MSDEQAERTRVVIGLLDHSFGQHQGGRQDRSDRFLTEANKIDAVAVTGIHGGMLIGEIPNPEVDPYVWAEWVAAANASPGTQVENQYEQCAECGEWVQATADAPGTPPILVPCGHRAAQVSICPSWNPASGCTCKPGVHGTGFVRF